MTSTSSPPRAALGLGSAAALVVGHTIGVGVFLTPSQLLGALASPAWALGIWIGSGLLVFAGALTLGELAARHPRSGGLYVYLSEAFGPRAAVVYGWQALLVMDPGIAAAIALGAADYVAVLVPAAAGHQKAVALWMIWILAAANLTGLRLGARVVNALTAIKVAAIAGVVAAAFLVGRGHAAHFVPFFARRAGAPPIGQALGLAFVAVFYSFGGFWEASRVAGEVRRPEKTVPRALALGVALVTLAYAATTAAFLYLVPFGAANDASELARRAGDAMLARGGPAALSAVVLLSVVVSAFALFLMAPRLYVAMSRDGLFPATLAVENSRGAPARATAVLAAIASMLVMSGSFSEVVAYFLCPALFFLGLSAAALFVVRRKEPAAAFAVPGYPVTPVLFLLFLGFVIAAIAFSRPLQTAAGFALTAAGLPVYEILRSRRNRGEETPRRGHGPDEVRDVPAQSGGAPETRRPA
ncbi:MAG TPA: amino acid permease [Thermoanaerobaculia bacterium]|nr:amino acid permease [Thermoanaerobaculia bacterium]